MSIPPINNILSLGLAARDDALGKDPNDQIGAFNIGVIKVLSTIQETHAIIPLEMIESFLEATKK